MMLRLCSSLVCSLVLLSATAQVPDYVPTNGLVGYWDFQGNADDKSGNGLNGIVNGPTLCPDRYGNVNHAYSFDGVNDYIQVLDNNLLDLTTAGTISLWIYSPNLNYEHSFVSKGSPSDGYQIEVARNASNNTNFRFSKYSSRSYGSSLPNFWWHLTVTYDQQKVKFYGNGSVIDSLTTSGTLIPNAQNLLFGMNSISQTGFFKGILDDIGIWNRALTKAEIGQLRNGIPKALGDPKAFEYLTGGPSFPQGKSWKISASPYQSELGGINQPLGNWYNTSQGLKEPEYVNGMLANTYTFRYDSLYIPQSQRVSAHYAFANTHFGAHLAMFHDTALTDPDHKSASFKFARKPLLYSSTGYELSISDASYIGYFDKRSAYHIYTITTDTMKLCHTYSDDPTADPKNDMGLRCYTFYQVPTVITDLNQDQVLSPDMQVYPNPASHSVSFSSEVISATIADGTGKMVFSGNATKVDVQDWSKGIYLLKLTDKNGKSVYKKMLKE